ncbi:MAG: hypothetical protein KBT49_03190 [Bacteroidetes bacterium]|nr:hypothetical protein [Candidatus Colenecus caballi]
MKKTYINPLIKVVTLQARVLLPASPFSFSDDLAFPTGGFEENGFAD